MSVKTSMKVAKNVVTSKAGRQLLKGRKHSPVLLFGTGIIGFVGTVVLASKATLKLDALVEDNETRQADALVMLESGDARYSKKDYAKDSAKLKSALVMDVIKLYAPAAGLGVVTVCALGGSHVILTKRNAGLVAAYSALDKGYNEYRERVTALVGSDKELELRHGAEVREIAVDTEKGTEVQSVTTHNGKTHSQYARFFDQMCPAWKSRAEFNLFFLRSQQAYANDMLQARGHVFLNEVYDQLGIDRTKAGAVVGWVKNNADNFIDFGIYDGASGEARMFVNGVENSILLDFNVDGVVLDLI